MDNENIDYEAELNKMPLKPEVRSITLYGLLMVKNRIEANLELFKRLTERGVLTAMGMKMLIAENVQKQAMEWRSSTPSMDECAVMLQEQYGDIDANTVIRGLQATVKAITPENGPSIEFSVEKSAPTSADDILDMWR
jgi:hypothetical protein